MNILIIGSGGREYAIGLRLTQDNQKHNLFFSPGNGATANLGQNVDIKDFNELAKFALENKIELNYFWSISRCCKIREFKSIYEGIFSQK